MRIALKVSCATFMLARTGLRVAAGLACLAALVVGAPAARADHTPAPSTVALVGSLQSELGCPGDWQPECPQTRLQPVAGSPGVFRATFNVPAGSYEYKVALNNSFDENYGAGGVSGGANIPITAPGGPVTFTYDHATHVIADDAPRPLQAERGAHWVRTGVIAWQPPASAQTYRLHYAPEGGLRVEDGAIAGGSSVPLTLNPAGLPADVRATFPHLAAYPALELTSAARGLAPSLLTGELVVAAYDSAGALLQTTGVQIPGVLDNLYARAGDVALGPVWSDGRRARHDKDDDGGRRSDDDRGEHGGRPSLAVWAPTAKNVDLQLDAVGPRPEQRVAMRRGADGVWRVTGDGSWRNAAYRYEVTVYVPTLDRVVTNAVTDPYSVALTTNSARSVLADLDDPALKPNGWEQLEEARPDAARGLHDL